MSTNQRPAQKHLQALAATLTATEGPLRKAIDELGRIGIGARIIKSALAATLAWIIAGFLPRESAPFVAALTALYTVDLTILKSLKGAGQRFAGIVLGIGMAFLAAELFGVHAWSVGLVILFSMMVGLRLNLQPDGMAQVAGTAIIVLVVRSTTEERSYYALTFLADTAIGTLIGLTVNALLIPPNYLPGTHRTLNLLIDRLTDVIERLATMVVDGLTREETEALSSAIDRIGTDLTKVDESLDNATDALRFNVMAASQRSSLEHVQSVDSRLDAIVRSLDHLVLSLDRAVDETWMSNTVLTEALADLVSATSIVLLAQGESESAGRADPASLADVQDRMKALSTVAAANLTDGWVSLGHVVACANALGEAAIALNRE